MSHTPTPLFRLLLWLLLPAGAFFTSCKKDAEPEPKPVAAFTATAGTCQTGCPVTFQNTSKNATSYTWSFGDNSTGTQADAQFSHTYAAAGSYTVTLTAKGNGGTDVTTRTVQVGSASSCANRAVVQVTTHITQPTTWENCKVYVVNGTIGVGSILTIQPGAIVKFKTQSSGLDVTGNGRINAVGTATEPIVFTSFLDDARGGDTNGDGNATTPAKKNWDDVNLNGVAGSNFEYCQFFYGGNNTHACTLSLSTVWGTVRNCTFAYNAGRSTYQAGALEARSSMPGTIIQNNTFYKNELPLSVGNMYDLDNSNTFHNPANPSERNDHNGIWVYDGGSNSPALTWAETEVPFVLSSAGFQSTLTLAPGVMIKFTADADLTLGNTGRLLARGTAAQPIVFTSYHNDAVGGDTNFDGSTTTPAKADWGLVRLNASTGSAFDHCRFTYGGENGSALDMFGGVASVTNSIFAHNGKDVSTLTHGALNAYGVAAGSIIQNNTFYDNVRPLSIASSIDLDDSNTFHNPANPSQKNQYQGIIVYWNSNVTKTNVVWRETELAYVQTTTVGIAQGKTLELGNNVVLKFMPGMRMVVPAGSGHLINAQGTGVRYTSYKDDSVGGDSNGNGSANGPTAGDWTGIYIDSVPGVWAQWSNKTYAVN